MKATPPGPGRTSLYPGLGLRERTSTADGLRLIPLESVDRLGYRPLDREIRPPWRKPVYGDPEGDSSQPWPPANDGGTNPSPEVRLRAIRTWPREIKLTAAALGLALGTTLAFLFMPAYGGGGGEETLIDHEGAWVAAIMGIPIAIAAAPLIVPARSRRLALLVSSGLAVAFVLATGFTIGLFYAPTAVLLMVAASGARRRTAEP